MADLKPPLTGYALWLEAREPEQQFLQSLVDDLAREYNTRPFGAHATLLGLLDKGEADLDTIGKACEEIASEYRGVVTEIVGVGIRNMHFQSVFLLVAPSKDLVAMNHRARALLGHEDDPPFMPHWSAVYGDPDRRMQEFIARELINRVTLPRVVTVSNIALVDVQGYPDEWKVVKQYPFAES